MRRLNDQQRLIDAMQFIEGQDDLNYDLDQIILGFYNPWSVLEDREFAPEYVQSVESIIDAYVLYLAGRYHL